MPAEGFVILTMAFRQDGRRWTGECLELGTATYARTLNQVSDELHELVTLHLNALDDIGECDRFFQEHGIRFYTDAVMAEDAAPRIPTDGDAFFQARRVLVGGLAGAGA